MKRILFYLLLALIFLYSQAPDLLADVFDDIGQNIYDFHVKSNLNPADPYEGPSLQLLEERCNKVFNLQAADGRFTDLKSYTKDDYVWMVHMWRLEFCIIAYLTPNQKWYKNARIPIFLKKGLEYVNIYVDGYSGWGRSDHFIRDIALPNSYSRILLLANKGGIPLSNDVRDTIMRILDTLVVTDQTDMDPDESNGANGIWNMVALLQYSVLKKEYSHLNYAVSEINRLLRIKSSSPSSCSDAGIKPDYSFKQHCGCPMTGTYGTNIMGGSFIGSAGMYIKYVDGTYYQLPSSTIQNVVNWAADGLIWKVYHNYFDPAVMGRMISCKNRLLADRALNALSIIANLPSKRQTELIAAFKRIMESWESKSVPVKKAIDFRYSSYQKTIMDSSVAPASPIGHRHYPWADHTVHRNNKWFASLKMYSNKVKFYECFNDENKKGWHRSSGWLYVVNDGDEYMADNTIPTLDWNHLPGTTVEQKTYKEGAGCYKTGTRSFVGGVFTDKFGVSAMDFKPPKDISSLTAKKSWFFFDDEIVALGSDIDCSVSKHRWFFFNDEIVGLLDTNIDCNTSNPIHTTINQWPLSKPETPLYVDGKQKLLEFGYPVTFSKIKWANNDGIGYYFPGGQTIKGVRKNQSGKWTDISKGIWSTDDNILYNKTFLTLWFDHDIQGPNKSYSYVILPNKNKTETEIYANSDPITILALSNKIHAVKDNKLDAVGIVFWSSSGGVVGKISVNKDCIVFYRVLNDTFIIALSDPKFESDTIVVRVNEQLSPKNLPTDVSSYIDSNDTIITFNVDKGRSYVAEFSRSHS